MTTELVEELINDYVDVEPKVTAAMTSNSNLLAEGVASYVNSLPEVTDEQVTNLIKFLTRWDFTPLVRFDCVRELTTGPVHNRLVSAKLALQLSTALPLFEKREKQKKETLWQIKCTVEVEELPVFLVHEDPEIVEEAKHRMVYLNTRPEEPIGIKAFMTIPESKRLLAERRRLAQIAQDLFVEANKPNVPERWRKCIRKKANEIIAAKEKLYNKL